MKLDLFFATQPVFTIKEVKCFLGTGFKQNSTLGNLLRYHQKQGHILFIRKGIYAVIPREAQGTENFIDPYLITSKLSEDAVLSYQTALALHGKGYTMGNTFYYLTRTRKNKDFEFQGNLYRAVSIPLALQKMDKIEIYITRVNRLGLDIFLTSLERTFVDILDRPNLCMSWEEVFRSVEAIEYLSLEAVVEYTMLLNKRTVCAVVGFFLETYRDKWQVSDLHLETLQKFRPKTPCYLKRAPKGPQKLVAKWNLIIPQAFLDKNWEEPHEDI